MRSFCSGCHGRQFEILKHLWPECQKIKQLRGEAIHASVTSWRVSAEICLRTMNQARRYAECPTPTWYLLDTATEGEVLLSQGFIVI